MNQIWLTGRPIYMAHPLAPNLRPGYLNTAFIADNTLVPNTFIFSTGAFPVLRRAEYPLQRVRRAPASASGS